MKYICPMPFMAVCPKAINDVVVPCCDIDRTLTDLSDWQFSNQTFNEVFYSDKWNRLRQEFIEGKRPQLCKTCWDREDKNLTSPRHDALDNHSFSITQPKITYADLKFSNECNLSCRMCFPGSSNQIDKLISTEKSPKHLWGKKQKQFDSNIFNVSNKVESTKELIDNGLEVLKVTGGEPFVSKSFHNVLDYAIESGAAGRLKIKLTTNGTKFNKKLLEKLDNFKWIDYTISIDGYQKSYEYIRHPFTWNLLNKRIDNFINFYQNKNNFSARVEMLLMIYNAFDCKKLDNWWEEKRKKHRCLKPLNITPHVKTPGNELGIRLLTKELKDMVEGPHRVKQYINSYYKYEDKQALSRLKETVMFYDDKLGKKYQDYLHPEIVEFISNIC